VNSSYVSLFDNSVTAMPIQVSEQPAAITIAPEPVAPPTPPLVTPSPVQDGPSWRSRTFAQTLDRTGVVAAARLANRLRSVPILVLGYHRVWDSADEAFPYDLNLISCDRQAFRRQMEFVARHYDPISLADLSRALDNEVMLPARPAIVTFDDGYEDNYTHAFPILRELGLPATIFVSTGYIGGTETFWFDRVCQIILANPGATIEIGRETCTVPQDRSARRQLVQRVLRSLKRYPNTERLAILARLESRLGAATGPSHTAYSRPMNWDQIREMAAEGIEFASHTVTHPVLATCTDAELEFELRDSWQTLKSELGIAPTSISYPVGGNTAFDSRVVEATRAAGYRIAASYVHAINRLETLDRFAIRRIHVERYHDDSYFSAMLEFPHMFR
jgi:peptidoglycan/xylan/chitin deacetylase (PgdA/CDA1 family)